MHDALRPWLDEDGNPYSNDGDATNLPEGELYAQNSIPGKYQFKPFNVTSAPKPRAQDPIDPFQALATPRPMPQGTPSPEHPSREPDTNFDWLFDTGISMDLPSKVQGADRPPMTMPQKPQGPAPQSGFEKSWRSMSPVKAGLQSPASQPKAQAGGAPDWLFDTGIDMSLGPETKESPKTFGPEAPEGLSLKGDDDPYIDHGKESDDQFRRRMNEEQWKASSVKGIRDAKARDKGFGAAATGLEAFSEFTANHEAPEVLRGGFGRLTDPKSTNRQDYRTEQTALRQAGREGISDAMEERSSKMNRFAQMYGVEKDGRAAAKGAEYDNPESPVSKQATLLFKAAIKAKASEAYAAGKKEDGDALMAIVRDRRGMSANEAYSLYKNLGSANDYKDILNHMKAEAAAKSADSRAKGLLDHKSELDDKKDKKEKHNRATAIRKELNGNKLYQDTQELEFRLAQAEELAKDPTGATDESLLVIYNKGLDPGSVVREPEFDRSGENSGLMVKIQGYLTKLKDGQRLQPEQRKDLINAMKALREGARSYKKKFLSPYEREIRDYGLDRNIIMGSDGPAETPKPKAVSGADLP